MLNHPERNRFLPVFAIEIYIKILVMFVWKYISQFSITNITYKQIIKMFSSVHLL